MPFVLSEKTKHARLYKDVRPDGGHRGYVSCTIGPMHYESVLDSGDYDAPINIQMRRVTNAQLDGYIITDAGWHYAIQTVVPAASTVQPNSQAPVGTVGFGGRQGSHWFRFRLRNVGYVHWPTRTVDDLGGQPNYSAAIQMSEVTRNMAAHPEIPDDISVAKTKIVWPSIWTTPGGGEVRIEWTASSDGLKENIILNQAAREWLAANRPPGTPLAETYFAFRFQVDASDIPRAYIKGVLSDINNADIEDDEGTTELRDAQDRLLAFMPLDFVYARGRGGKRPLVKRFYRENNQTWLAVGVRLDNLAGLLPGDLVFDPSITTETIAATADDGYENSSNSMDTTPPYGNCIFVGRYSSGDLDAGFRFTPPIPNGASLTGPGESATLTCFRNSVYASSNPTLVVARIWGDDDDNAGAWADGTGAERPQGTGFVNTTAYYDIPAPADPGANGAWGGGWEVGNIVEEIVARAGWVSSNGMRFAIISSTAATGRWWGIADFSDSNTEARFDATYDVGGGGSVPVFRRHYQMMQSR